MTNGIPSNFLRVVKTTCDANNDIDNDNGNINDDGDDNRSYYSMDVNEITTSVPYFGVLSVGATPISESSSPPTVIHNGRHAKTLASILESHGIRCNIVGMGAHGNGDEHGNATTGNGNGNGLKEIDAAAIQKLIWISIMWLLCHDCQGDRECTSKRASESDRDGGPITCSNVHKLKKEQIQKLLRELVPAANELLEVYHPESSKEGTGTGTGTVVAGTARTGIGNIAEVEQHLQDYSFSMPSAIPNKQLAIEEFEQRNGYLLSVEGSAPQPIHRELVERVVGYIPEYNLDHNTK